MIVSGPTSCGKTFFVKEALRRSTCNPVPERIVWLYRRWQPLYDEIRKTVVPTVEFVRGIPTELEADHFFDARTRNLLVLDDLMSTSAKDRRINDLFTEGSHHRNLSVVAVNQNLYFGKDPTQRRNCHYLVLFDNPVDRQPVATLGRQMYPSQRHLLMQTFREATRRPFGYLLVDLKAATPEHLRLRSDVLGGGEDDAEAEDEDVDSTGSESNTMEFGEEDVGSESDLMACRACGLVFAHARGLEIHQERDCGDEPSAKRCRTEDDGVEGTYGYELECYLEDLPATVCCADELPDEVSNRPRSFVVNTDDCDGKGIHWVAFHFPREGPVEFFFDSFGRSPEYYHRRFMNVLIANGPQYRFSTTQVQPGSSDTCGLYCVHFVKMRYRNISMEDIVKDFSSRDLMSNDDKLLALYE
ncbi:Hypothetical predicted protein [Mytilus galloprovincialis]|uniref:C2H2-type domain-containing protein n=1 Tax=Mytilus galloprovincialis TaxID=29158 RepID=A0A8B6CKH9_MYTGA|nr:Hypothetical predicted protein [Mytilus galloprovincialis]